MAPIPAQPVLRVKTERITMSKTNTTSTPATSIELVDPASLLVDLNVRHDPRLDAAFSASIKELGVLVPIVAVRTAEKQLRVRFGHRRTLAAVAAGMASVPVVVAADEATTDAANVERLVGQYAENEHRTGLSNAERIGVIEQLSAFGVSSAQIAKRTKPPAPTSTPPCPWPARIWRKPPPCGMSSSTWFKRPRWPTSRTTRTP